MVFAKNPSSKVFESSSKTTPADAEHKKKAKAKLTRVVVRYDVGFKNQVYIRGKGAGLNWEKGTLLKNTKPDEWVWETDIPFNSCEFKVLINDSQYEQGENHILHVEQNMIYTPRF